jgi:hypothetical protein
VCVCVSESVCVYVCMGLFRRRYVARCFFTEFGSYEIDEADMYCF